MLISFFAVSGVKRHVTDIFSRLYVYFHTSCLFYDLFGTDVLVSVYFCLLWTATTLLSLYTHAVYYLLNCIGYLSSDSSTSCLIRALVPYRSRLLLFLNHVVIIVKLYSPKMKCLHRYNGIYYTWEKTPEPPNAGNEIQSFVGIFNFISWGVSSIKKYKQTLIGYFWFKVMTSSIYSIQREIIQDMHF